MLQRRSAAAIVIRGAIDQTNPVRTSRSIEEPE